MEEKKEERSKSHNLQNYTEEGVHTENSKKKKKQYMSHCQNYIP